MRVGLLLLLVSASVAIPARAQERTDEESEVRHVYDETPVWETDAHAWVELRARHDLTVCRQGRVVWSAGIRMAHMGCWTGSGLVVPTGLAYLAVRRGLDVEWIGGGPISLQDGDALAVQIDDRSAARIVGWTLFAVAIVTTLVFGIGLGTQAFRADVDTLLPFTIAAASIFVGLGLAFLNDGVELTFVRRLHPAAE